MRREGRQHGMVRTYTILPSPWNPRPNSRPINGFDSPPTAGLFTKVSPKPTNHSKFTSKCGRTRCRGCREHPVSKSKDKAKGTHKLRSCDVASNYRLVSWRVVDAKPGLKFAGFSASGILDHLDSDYKDDDDCVDEGSCDLGRHDSVGFEIGSGAIEIKDNDDDREEDASFYDLALVWERADEDEDWCLVAQM